MIKHYFCLQRSTIPRNSSISGRFSFYMEIFESCSYLLSPISLSYCFALDIVRPEGPIYSSFIQYICTTNT